MDGIFKASKQTDYLNLPAQINQHVIKQVFQDWESFYNADTSHEFMLPLGHCPNALGLKHFKADNEIDNKDIMCKICSEYNLVELQ